MNPQDELSVAKSVIADQQIALTMMNRQLRGSYSINPEGALVHHACGEETSYDEELTPNFRCSCTQ